MKQYFLVSLILSFSIIAYGTESSGKQQCIEWAEIYSVEDENKDEYIEDCLINLSYEESIEQEPTSRNETVESDEVDEPDEETLAY